MAKGQKMLNYRFASLLALLLACETASAQETGPDQARRVDHDTLGKANEDDIAKELENPIGNLTVLPLRELHQFRRRAA